MNKEINLGNLIIPIIKPQKGKDYYTETEKQELISIVTDNVNAGVLPQEQTRQSNEIIRQNNEQTRQAQETIRQTNETNRQTAETERESAENTRQSNESSRVSAEQTRTQTFNNKMDAVDTAIAGIHTSQNAYDQNATAKTSAFNENATSKTSDYNTNATNKTAEYNENASTKIAEYDAHIRDYEAELATKVDKVAGKGLSTNDFTNEEKEKLAELHNYDDTELSERVDDIEQEQTTQNTNISNNTTNIESLQEENENLKKIVAQMPQVEGQGTEITLENTIEAQFTIFDVEGNSVQDGTPSPDNEVPILSAGDNGSINEKIQTRNLIDIIRTLGTPSNTGYDNTNKRTFDVTTLIKFLTANNYYNAGVQIDYSLTDNGIKITTKQAGYGIGFPVILSSTKTYTISANIDVIDNQMIRAIFYKEDGTYISNVTSSGTNKFLTFTTTDDTYFVVVMLTPKANVETTYSNIMLNEGNTALPYVPHEEQDYSIFVQQPMRSIGDVRDCFVKVNGNWYERHYIGRNYLKDYSYYFATTTDGNLFRIVASQLLDTKKIQQTLMCNIFIGIPSSTNRTNGNIYYNSFSGVVDIICNDYDNETDFKAMAINKNGYFDCILSEPLDLPCTEEQIQQLENLPSTYKDFTIIQSEDETPAYLEVSGIYDLNKLITRTEVLESEV